MGQITEVFAKHVVQNAENNKHSPLTVGEEKQLAYAWLQLRALHQWLDNNMTFYDTEESKAPVLASVSKRIWYHATDDTIRYPFSEVASARIKQAELNLIPGELIRGSIPDRYKK